MPHRRNVEAELQAITFAFERYASFMAVIAGQSAIDALDFVCDEATREAKSQLCTESAQKVTTELARALVLANVAFGQAQRH